ncbi:Response regulator of zinc sigma-54-dependent two-component system [Minicystis rosea]|nr:Response regulator of zinc sigma-54-dependent two-component system [Minicystis rosea]
MADLNAAEGRPGADLGPVARAVRDRPFEHLVLLYSHPPEKAEAYAAWLRARTEVEITLRPARLTTPTHYGDIYREVTAAVASARERFGTKAALTFYLSPGTSAMTAIWILVAKTRFEAELIESSQEHGVVTAEVPFEIAAELVPSAMRRADEGLDRLAGGLRPERPQFGDIVYRSDVMRRLVERAQLAAAYAAPILLEGESGTGKELLAAAIHATSPRRDKPFVAINCGAIPRDLLESEFFGHEAGAFTGATRKRSGHFEAAHGGTLFLDEVGELPPDAQVKLLRALQEKKIQRVGASEQIPVDVRIVAATNRDLSGAVAAGRFREDLYFRLAVLVLRPPPLRERQGDVGLLVNHLLDKLNRDPHTAGRGLKELSPGARNLLLRHSWPGNVRELEATLVRVVVWSRGPTISADEIREAFASGTGERPPDVMQRPLGDGFSLTALLDEVSSHYLRRAMTETGRNKTKAAELLGFASYQTLSGWLKRHERKA